MCKVHIKPCSSFGSVFANILTECEKHMGVSKKECPPLCIPVLKQSWWAHSLIFFPMMLGGYQVK